MPGSKNIVRKKMMLLRDGYEKSWVDRCSKDVCGYILQNSFYDKSQNVFSYLAFGNEVVIDSVIQKALSDGKSVYVPYIVPGQKGVMQPVRLKSFAYIILGKYGIRTVRQPLEAALPSDMDVVLSPGLCFDRSGVRMGLGAGYYDRFLTQAVNAVKIGITLSPQIIENVPSEEHDVLMDYLVCEDGFIVCGNKEHNGGETIG